MDVPVTRPLLQAIARQNALSPNALSPNALSPDAIDSALQLSSLRPTTQQSLAFAIRACQLAGTLALAASIIFFVAANWQHFPPLTRFAIVEAPLLAALLFAFWKGPQHLSGQLALLLAILNTGALLALLGQTYQSGADVYELFAFWSLLSLSLAAAARYTPAWAVCFLIVNTTILLYPYNGYSGASLATFYTNLALFSLGEFLHHNPKILHSSGLSQAWLRYALLAISFAGGTFAAMESIFRFGGAQPPPSALHFPALLAAAAAIAFLSYRSQQSLFPFAVIGLSAVVTSTCVLIRTINSVNYEFIALYGLYILAASASMVKAIQWVRQQWAKHSPTKPVELL